MAEDNQIRSSSEGANDAVRSLALATAELWHEVLERLAHIEERQDALYQTINELKEGISAWQAEAIAQAEQRVDELQRAVMSELKGAIAGALGAGVIDELTQKAQAGSETEPIPSLDALRTSEPGGPLSGDTTVKTGPATGPIEIGADESPHLVAAKQPETGGAIPVASRPSMPPAVEPDPLFAVPPLMPPDSSTSAVTEEQTAPASTSGTGTESDQPTTKPTTKGTERRWLSRRRGRAQESNEERSQKGALPPQTELTPEQISAILDAEFGPSPSIPSVQAPTYIASEPSAIPELLTASTPPSQPTDSSSDSDPLNKNEPLQDAVLQALLGGATTIGSTPPLSATPAEPETTSWGNPEPETTSWGNPEPETTSWGNPEPETTSPGPSSGREPDLNLDPENVLGEIPAYPDSASSIDKPGEKARTLPPESRPSPMKDQISSWQTVLVQSQQQAPSSQVPVGNDTAGMEETRTSEILLTNTEEERNSLPPITPDFFATHRKHRFSRKK